MNNITKSGLVGLCLAGFLGCGPSQNENISLHTGESKRLGYHPTPVFLVYGGTTENNTRFVLSRGGLGTSIFYPMESKEISFEKYRFNVNFVCPDSIKLIYLGKVKS